MSHIHTKPGQHDHTASAFIIRTDGEEPKILLHLHKKLGKLMQFGGHIELDENPWQAITHEILEESGYDMDQLHVLQPRSRMKKLSGAELHPYPVCHSTHSFGSTKEGHFHTDSAYAFVTSEAPRHPLSEGESSDVRLLTRKELRALKDEAIIENVRDIALFVLDTCIPKWEHVDSRHMAVRP